MFIHFVTSIQHPFCTLTKWTTVNFHHETIALHRCAPGAVESQRRDRRALGQVCSIQCGHLVLPWPAEAQLVPKISWDVESTWKHPTIWGSFDEHLINFVCIVKLGRLSHLPTSFGHCWALKSELLYIISKNMLEYKASQIIRNVPTWVTQRFRGPQVLSALWTTPMASWIWPSSQRRHCCWWCPAEHGPAKPGHLLLPI